MATINGSTTTNYWTFKLEVTEGTPNIENNTSPVTVVAYIGRHTSGSYMYGARISCTVSCTGVSNQSISYNNSSRVDIAAGGWLRIGSVTFSAVPHNDDGSKTVTVGASFTNNIYPSSGAASGSVKLSTIARASQPSLVTWPDNTQNVGEFGDTIDIFMNRKSSSFTHTVRYEFGSLTGTIATNVANDCQWTIPLNFMDAIPSALQGSGRVYVDTYNGTTLIGTKYSGFTAAVPASVQPTCTLSLDDVTGIDEIYGSPVKGLSRIKVSVNASIAHSSPIASYMITANGASYNAQEAITSELIAAGASLVSVTVTDQRGRTGSASYTMNVLDYTRPAVTRLSVARCDSDGTLNNRGEHVKATFSALISSMSGLNTAAYSLKYKQTSETDFTEVAITELADNYAPENSTHIFAASLGKSYDVVITATDRHNADNPSSRSAKAPTASANLSLRGFANSSGGKDDGIGIGKVPEKPNVLQVSWDAEFDGNSLVAGESVVKGNQYAFSSPGVASTAGFVRMARLTHRKANADTPITFVFTRRLEPHPMTVHVQFRTDSTTTDPDLKGITYEGCNYGAFLVRSAASVWDLYVEKVSAYDTITLQSWFSSATVSDRLTVEFPGNLVAAVPDGLDGFYRATPAKLDSLLDHIFPVGTIYHAYGHTSPAELFGGTWTRITNTFLWATTSGGTIGQTGGTQTHTLTSSEMPKHSHYIPFNATGNPQITFPAWVISTTKGTQYGSEHAFLGGLTGSEGGGAAHNNMPPYTQVSVWRRTA